MEAENKELLIEGARTFGIDLDESVLEALDLYLKELFKWNEKINLTAVRSEKEVILKHFLDSLSVYPYLAQPSSILDMGSGAGFPGIPLRIIQPAFAVSLIDSTRKKVDFQKNILRRLVLKNTEAIHGRVQDAGILRDLAGRFDIVLSRAFSDLQTFLTLALPFLKEGGTVISMKGAVDPVEIRRLAGIKEMRYRLQKTIPLILPFSSFKRTILLFEKI